MLPHVRTGEVFGCAVTHVLLNLVVVLRFNATGHADAAGLAALKHPLARAG